MKIATLEADVDLSVSGFESGVASVRLHMAALQGEFDSVDKKATETGDVLKTALGTGLGQIVAEGVKEAMGALWDFGVESVKVAAEIESASRAAQVTFGDYYDDLNIWAEGSKTAFGMAEGQAKRYASRVASVLSAQKLPTNEIYEMSTSLVALAGDLAAFNGLSVDVTMEKILSGMRGETEAIEDLGVDVRAATLAAYAGMSVSDFGKIETADRMRITFQSIMDQSKKAQGFFAENENTYSSQMAILEANITSLKETMGNQLLPVLTDMLTWFNGLFGSSENAADGIEAIKESSKDSLFEIKNTASEARALVEALERMSAAGEDAANADTWNAVLAQLEKTIPGIGNLIDEETGKIEGGTTALREYIDSWQEYALTQAKQKAMQSMYDKYAQYALEIVELQNDQYVADTLEANAIADKAAIVEKLAQAAFEYQKAAKPGSVQESDLDIWRTGIAKSLSSQGDITGWFQDMESWGKIVDDLGFMSVSKALQGAGLSVEDIEWYRDEYQTLEAKRAEYAGVDLAAEIADREAALAKSGEELETVATRYDQILDLVKENSQATEETMAQIAASETPQDGEVKTANEIALETANENNTELKSEVKDLKNQIKSMESKAKEETQRYEAQLDLLREMLDEEAKANDEMNAQLIAAQNGFGVPATSSAPASITVVLEVDGSVLAEVVAPYLNEQQARDASTSSKTN